MTDNQSRPKDQAENGSSIDDKKILITICHQEYNLEDRMYINKDKKLLYCIDNFCKKIKMHDEDVFYTDFDFFLQNDNNNQKLDPYKTIKENKIPDKSKIIAQYKPKNKEKISLKIKDLENRLIPSEIKYNSKIKEGLKHICDSLSIDINNTLFLSKDKKIDIDHKVKDLDYLKDKDVITIAQMNPTFTILVENVPYGTQEIELLAFLKDYQPKKCDIFEHDQASKSIPGYATISFQSQSDAMSAIIKCSKDKFKNHKMAASIQNF